MKIFYGWIIVGIGIVVSCVGMGTMMSLAVFLQPISSDSPTKSPSRGRDAAHAAPPAQIRACAANAPGSYLGCLTSKR
jgi:hypothetical protein